MNINLSITLSAMHIAQTLGTYLAASFNPYCCDDNMAWFVDEIDQRFEPERNVYWFGNFLIQVQYIWKIPES